MRFGGTGTALCEGARGVWAEELAGNWTAHSNVKMTSSRLRIVRSRWLPGHRSKNMTLAAKSILCSVAVMAGPFCCCGQARRGAVGPINITLGLLHRHDWSRPAHSPDYR